MYSRLQRVLRSSAYFESETDVRMLSAVRQTLSLFEIKQMVHGVVEDKFCFQDYAERNVELL